MGEVLGNEDFFKILLDETFQETKQSDTSLGHDELCSYFNMRTVEVSDKFNKNADFLTSLEGDGILFFNGEYNEVAKCFRLEIPGGHLDFPKNWDLFNNINCDNDSKMQLIKPTDDSCLAPVMRPFCSYNSEQIFLFSGNKFWLIFPRNSDSLTKNAVKYFGANLMAA